MLLYFVVYILISSALHSEDALEVRGVFQFQKSPRMWPNWMPHRVSEEHSSTRATFEWFSSNFCGVILKWNRCLRDLVQNWYTLPTSSSSSRIFLEEGWKSLEFLRILFICCALPCLLGPLYCSLALLISLLHLLLCYVSPICALLLLPPVMALVSIALEALSLSLSGM